MFLLNAIDEFLNKYTMYRVMLWYLICLWIIAIVLGFFGILSYSPVVIFLEGILLVSVSYGVNKLFSLLFHAPTNFESVYISALILVFLITPVLSLDNMLFMAITSVLAMASKYLLTFHKKHMFNPVAIALVITSFALGKSASWWIGTASMLPFVLIGGLLVVRKIQRGDLVLSFFLTATATMAILSFSLNPSDLLKRILLDTPLVYCGLVMLTEPSTTPPTRMLRVLYGGIVGILFAPGIFLYATPELALVIGNIFSFLVSPKAKFFLSLKEKIQLAPDMADFVFPKAQNFSFTPGQYMEWTLAHSHTDFRGNRRYFTLASSPTEETIRIGVRFNEPSSSFKKALNALNTKKQIIATQLSGEFVLPKNTNQKLAFLAGGIGITPYRSMIKYLLDKNQKRDIVLFYAAKDQKEFAYVDIFNYAQKLLGINTVYAITDTQNIPKNWKGQSGRITPEMIKNKIPDYKERLFYLSGPQQMVKAFEKLLKDMGITGRQIKKDFFPGF
ncbi:MAG TPA: FAD-dependent oxidoreductase [Patescibacteria group bacterium]|nr:FAD-dependent oxidoreductase [Patescibacteria group bacterium]